MLKEPVAARGLDLSPKTRQKPGKPRVLDWMRGLQLTVLGLAGCCWSAVPSPAAAPGRGRPYEQFNRDAVKRNAKIDTYFAGLAVDIAMATRFTSNSTSGGRRDANISPCGI
jgi:hypothetical protein